MQDGPRGDFQKRLRNFLSEMEQAYPLIPRGQRVSGGRCRLDAETFQLLTKQFRSGHYSKGIMESYSRVIGVALPTDLQRSSLAVRQLRAEKGGHVVHVTVFQSELEEVNRAATHAEMTVPALLEACTYLFLHVGGG